MENWIDSIIKFMLVTSVFILVLGIVSWLVVNLLKVKGRTSLWICSIVVLMPLVYPLQTMLPDHAKVLVPPERLQSFYSRAIEPEPGNQEISDDDLPINGTEAASVMQPISTQTQTSTFTISNSETLKPINKKSFVYSINWKPALAMTWIVLVILMLVRFVSIVKKTRLLLKCADCVTDPCVLELLQQCSAETGLRRVPRLLAVDHLLTPMAVGFFHPAIILPVRLLEPEFQEGLQFTLLHELKHLQRHDNWWLLIESLMSAAYFFHPVIYWAKNRIHEEWEYICDNHVIRVTHKSASYADFLLHEIWNHGREMNPSLAAPFILSMPKTTKRVYSILDKKKPTLFTKIRDRIAVILILFSFISLLLCSLTPSAHVREDEMSRDRIALIDKPGEDNISTVIRTAEESKTSLQDKMTISQQELLRKVKNEKLDKAVENIGPSNTGTVNVSYVSESTKAMKEDGKKIALLEGEEEQAGRATVFKNDINFSDAAKTDVAVPLQEHAGVNIINAQLIAGDIPEKGSESNLSLPIVTASLNIDKDQIQLGNAYSAGIKADATVLKGDDKDKKPAPSKVQGIPEKYNFDSQLERVSKFWKSSPVYWKRVDNQSFILENGLTNYYLLVLETPCDRLLSSRFINLTGGLIRPVYSEVIVSDVIYRGVDQYKRYIISRIYKLKTSAQIKAIMARLSSDKNKAGVGASTEATGKTGESASIPNGTRIYDWKMIDNRNLIIKTVFYGDFMATLEEGCPEISSNDIKGVEAKWSYGLDGQAAIIFSNNHKCKVQKLDPYSEKEKNKENDNDKEYIKNKPFLIQSGI